MSDKIATREGYGKALVEFADKYDYVVLNEDGKVAECAAKVHHIIETEKKRTMYSGQLINELTEGLARYKKGE